MSLRGWEGTIIFGARNLAAVLLGALLIAGVAGKLKARLSGHSGPALLQPWRDLLKLFGKEELFEYGDRVGRWAPAAGFASLMAAALLVSMGAARAPASFAGDSMALVGLVMLVGAAALAAATTGRGGPGRSGAILCTVAAEPPVILCITGALLRGSSFSLEAILQGQRSGTFSSAAVVGAVSMLIALVVCAARGTPRLPAADLGEGGDFPGLSGPKLALAWWSAHARVILYAAIFIELYLSWPGLSRGGAGFAACLAKILVIAALVHCAAALRTRLLRSEIWLGASWSLAVVAVVASALGL